MTDRADNRQFDNWEKGPSLVSIHRLEAQKLALEYRKEGLGYDEIASRMGISRNAAAQAVKKALKSLLADTREVAEDVVALEVARLDEMLVPTLRMARAGNLEAVDRALKIQDRRAKYLGLDQAIKTQISIEQSAIPLRGLSADDLDALEAMTLKALDAAGREVESESDGSELDSANLNWLPPPTISRKALRATVEESDAD